MTSKVLEISLLLLYKNKLMVLGLQIPLIVSHFWLKVLVADVICYLTD